jgi:pimeloyl-ACP methyl ester carboxylesterase
LYYILYTM